MGLMNLFESEIPRLEEPLQFKDDVNALLFFFPPQEYQYSGDTQLYYRNDSAGVCLVLKAVGLTDPNGAVPEWGTKLQRTTVAKRAPFLKTAFDTANLLCRIIWYRSWDGNLPFRGENTESRHVLASFYAFVQGFKSYYTSDNDEFPFPRYLENGLECNDVNEVQRRIEKYSYKQVRI